MKGLHKIFLSGLIGAILFTSTFCSASAMDEDIAQEESQLSTPALFPRPELETKKTIQDKISTLEAEYQKILITENVYVQKLHKWKVETHSYLIKLYEQSKRYPDTIKKDQILDFFATLAKKIYPEIELPSRWQGDYKISFRPRYGLAGSIFCFLANDPDHPLIIL